MSNLKTYLERNFSINSIDIARRHVNYDDIIVEVSSSNSVYPSQELILSGEKAEEVILSFHSSKVELFGVMIRQYHTIDNIIRMTLHCDYYFIDDKLGDFESFYDEY